MATRITVFAAPSNTDTRSASTTVREVPNSSVNETLRQIGLEWKNADYFTQRQVVITLDPVSTEQDLAEIKEMVKTAARSLEATGLL